MATQMSTMTTSDFNLERLSTKQLSDHLSTSIRFGENVSIFGRRGVGKTAIAKQEISKLGAKEVYWNLSVMEKTDLSGFPKVFSAKDEKYVDYLLPNYYECLLEGDQPVVLLLDEVDKASPELWAPLLELTQFRKINGRILPNLHAIIMTGNLIAEGGSRPSLPLLDRAEKYLVEADVESWLNWSGREGKIHSAIATYINDNPLDLFGNVDPADRYADPSPRGWHRASEILHKGEAMGINPTMLNEKVCGCVGKSAGIKYSIYYEHYQKLLPMIENIFHGKDVNPEYQGLEQSNKLVACMITCARVASILDRSKPGEPLDPSIRHVGRFLQKVSYENILVAVRSQIQLARLLKYGLDTDENKEWKQLLKTIHSHVTGKQ